MVDFVSNGLEELSKEELKATLKRIASKAEYAATVDTDELIDRVVDAKPSVGKENLADVLIHAKYKKDGVEHAVFSAEDILDIFVNWNGSEEASSDNEKSKVRDISQEDEQRIRAALDVVAVQGVDQRYRSRAYWFVRSLKEGCFQPETPKSHSNGLEGMSKYDIKRVLERALQEADKIHAFLGETKEYTPRMAEILEKAVQRGPIPRYVFDFDVPESFEGKSLLEVFAHARYTDQEGNVRPVFTPIEIARTLSAWYSSWKLVEDPVEISVKDERDMRDKVAILMDYPEVCASYGNNPGFWLVDMKYHNADKLRREAAEARRKKVPGASQGPVTSPKQI